MLAEVIWEPKETEVRKAHPHALINLNEAREFYKTNFFSQEWNLCITKNDSKENILIWIWWTPPIESKLSKIAHAISTQQDKSTFLKELEEAYKIVYEEAARYHDPKIPFNIK